jgi:sigma-B regulation protein RsbU (phosphoserine phosphatase)
MPRSRLPEALAPQRRAAAPLPPALPGTESVPTARDLLLHSRAGRLFLIAAGLKVVIAILRRLVDPPAFVEALSSAATIALVVSVGYFVWRLFVLVKRRLLWRVRRKLILSYIFIGVVPTLLIIAFFLLGASAITMNVSAYLFKDGYDDIMSDARLIAQAAAAEIARNPATTAETIARVHRNAAQSYRGITLVFVPMGAGAPPAAQAGRWEHVPVPATIPDWLSNRGDGFAGSIAVPLSDSSGEAELVVRAAIPANTKGRRLGFVITDVPIDGEMLDALYEETRVRGSSVQLRGEPGGAGPVVSTLNDVASRQPNQLALFSRSVGFFDYRDWATGTDRRATIPMTYRLRDLYSQLSGAQSAQFQAMTLGEAFLLMLVVIAVLFLIIEAVALVMGLALARSITSSIHELFMSTERVRQGDFTHRIDIRTKDQLGELAESFNQMTASIENLLQTAAEKKRLDEELRIARQIQMSLLPRGPLDLPGLGVTALCVPAREVGGDYYDFFPLGNDRVGVLIADVSGKGTSAALYMAELKGLVLSLSEIYESPRQLLIEVNRIISANLDSRSFITMTYAVLDLAQRTMTFARAGHTPLIYLPSGEERQLAQVLVPNGMVLGLRIDGAAEKFQELLEEDRIDLNTGDVIVLYTDGITEAMNPDADLFGESRLSRIVEEHGHLDSGELRERILREIEAFVGAADQHDDMTMILLKVEPIAVAAKVAV